MARWRLCFAALATGVSLAGCGAVAVRVGAGGTLEVALSEYRINPREATAAPGVVTFVVRNYGRLTHDLVIALDGRQAGSTPSIPPGGEATITLELGPGQYTMASTILQDSDLGVRGTLSVT
jgi:hypothetical protein